MRSTWSVAAVAVLVWVGGASGCSRAQALPDVQKTLSAKGERVVALELRAAPPAASVPIRTGVPFPAGALASLNQLRLEASDGREVPAQFDTLATWPDGSLKVVLVQIVGDLGRAQRYRLAYGAGVARKPPPRKIVTQNSDGGFLVDTGEVQFVVNKQGVLHRLWRDLDRNGKYEPREQLIDGGDIYLVNAVDDQEYAASAADKVSVVLEESGPVRAVVKVFGQLTSAKRGEHMKYLVRYYASQGSDKVDIELSVIDDRMEENVERVPPTLAIAAKTVGMRWHYLSDAQTLYRFGGESSDHAGKVSGEHYLLQNGEFRYVDGDDQNHTFAYSGVGSGSRAAGWLALDAGSRHLTLQVRDFWQQFPSELAVDRGNLSAKLFSTRGVKGKVTPPPSSPAARPTGARTASTSRRPAAPRRTSSALAAPRASLRRRTSPPPTRATSATSSTSWRRRSGTRRRGCGVRLEPAAPSHRAPGYDAALMNDIYMPSIERSDGDATMFGWRDYGDRLRAGWADVKNDQRIPSFYNDTHVGANNFLKQFIRTGDQRWFHLGEIATRHVMDIDVAHGPRRGYWQTGGKPQPAGELRAANHDNIDHDARNLHWGHAHVSGMSELYLLTGDKRSLDVLKEMAAWWKFVTPHFFSLPFNAKGKYREAERDYGWPLYVMNEYVRVTGDSQYHREVAGHLVNYLIQWWQTPLQHIGYNPATKAVSNAVVGVNDARSGTGYWTMSRMDNCGPADKATGANPWMAGALIGNLIKFYEQDMQLAAAGKGSGISQAVLQDMLLQAQNYLVKYGYDPQKRFFAYSETMRDDGGDHHIIYGLAYLDRLFKRELPHAGLLILSGTTLSPGGRRS